MEKLQERYPKVEIIKKDDKKKANSLRNYSIIFDQNWLDSNGVEGSEVCVMIDA
jgi:hypothetical protein